MLFLDFGSVADRMNSVRVGPSQWFRVGGNFIRDENGQIVAHYKRHFWFIGERAFTRYESDLPILVHFEDLEGGKSDTYGPYPSAWVADGSAYRTDRLFAKFIDTTLLWHDHESDTFWPWMVWSWRGE